MNVSNYLAKAAAQLHRVGIESARLDCLILLEDATGKNRAWLLAHPEHKLDDAQVSKLNDALARRTKHEPLAYIRGKVEFYGRTFYVDKNVLIPRPESESFIELLKKHKLNTDSTHVLDLGTGSGCIGLTLGLELQNSKIMLADIDENALETARKNTTLLGADATFMQTDLLSTIIEHFDIIVTNLPYVPNDFPLARPLSYEPKLALFAGSDGMDLYRKFWTQVREHKHKPVMILSESLLDHHTAQKALAEAAKYTLSNTDGLVQLFTLRES